MEDIQEKVEKWRKKYSDQGIFIFRLI